MPCVCVFQERRKSTSPVAFFVCVCRVKPSAARCSSFCSTCHKTLTQQPPKKKCMYLLKFFSKSFSLLTKRRRALYIYFFLVCSGSSLCAYYFPMSGWCESADLWLFLPTAIHRTLILERVRWRIKKGDLSSHSPKKKKGIQMHISSLNMMIIDFIVLAALFNNLTV